MTSSRHYGSQVDVVVKRGVARLHLFTLADHADFAQPLLLVAKSAISTLESNSYCLLGRLEGAGNM